MTSSTLVKCNSMIIEPNLPENISKTTKDLITAALTWFVWSKGIVKRYMEMSDVVRMNYSYLLQLQEP